MVIFLAEVILILRKLFVNTRFILFYARRNFSFDTF